MLGYYVLRMDERLRNAVRFSSFSQQNAKSEDDLLVFEAIEQNTKIPDYIMKQIITDMYHVVSDTVLNVMAMYSEEIEKRLVFLTDTKGKEQHIFWEVKLPVLDCVQSGKNIEKLILNKAKIHDEALFTIRIEKASYLIVRYDAAESILRRNPLGIKFISITLSDISNGVSI